MNRTLAWSLGPSLFGFTGCHLAYIRFVGHTRRCPWWDAIHDTLPPIYQVGWDFQT